MSEHEDFKAWLKTWALPGNTSREDAMYAAWQARAARTAPAEPVAYLTSDRRMLVFADKVVDLGHGMTPLYTAPDALQAEVERLKHFEAAYMEWSDKTEWARSIVETKDLGKHLADVMREKFERLREEVERLKEELEENNSDAAVAAIKFALENTDYPEEFLRDWFEGDFESIRSEFPDAPDELFIGADPLFNRTAKPEVNHE